MYVDAISWGCTVTIITQLATTSFNVRGKNKIQIAASIGNNGNWIVQRDVKKTEAIASWTARHIMSSSGSSHPMVAVNNILSAKDDREEKRVICNFACFRLATGWD